MKIREVNFSLSHLFILILILSSFSIGQARILFAYDEHSGQAIEPVMTAPQSEGAKIVSKFEYEPIEFTPPKPERMVLVEGARSAEPPRKLGNIFARSCITLPELERVATGLSPTAARSLWLRSSGITGL